MSDDKRTDRPGAISVKRPNGGGYATYPYNTEEERERIMKNIDRDHEHVMTDEDWIDAAYYDHQ